MISVLYADARPQEQTVFNMMIAADEIKTDDRDALEMILKLSAAGYVLISVKHYDGIPVARDLYEQIQDGRRQIDAAPGYDMLTTEFNKLINQPPDAAIKNAFLLGVHQGTRIKERIEKNETTKY